MKKNILKKQLINIIYIIIAIPLIILSIIYMVKAKNIASKNNYLDILFYLSFIYIVIKLIKLKGGKNGKN